jgi:hypothetical protein
MTREDIIRMAREAGGTAFDCTVVFTYEEARRFMALAAAAERQRFAALCAALCAALAQPDKCEWAQEDESSDAWDTGCGRTFLINDGTPPENGMRYCCFCGKTLIGVPFEQENSGNE